MTEQIVRLFRDRNMDTFAIAKKLNIPEAMAYNLLSSRPQNNVSSPGTYRPFTQGRRSP